MHWADNWNDQYNPASMLKVVIMVSFLKESESNPNILNSNLVYTSAIDGFLKQDQYDTTSNLKIGIWNLIGYCDLAIGFSLAVNL